VRWNCRAEKLNHAVLSPPPVSFGVGSELSKLMAKFGIKANEGCKCKARAEEMNRRGVAWCEKNLELIVDWLEEEASKRHLPFLRTAGKILVRLAIRNAKQQSLRDHLVGS
jgi:hypothetical protein